MIKSAALTLRCRSPVILGLGKCLVTQQRYKVHSISNIVPYQRLSGFTKSETVKKLLENMDQDVAAGKTLASVEQVLNSWLKPQILGEGWDNIGLLVGSGRHEKEQKRINEIMLCNDLTLPVLDEAIAKNVDMIISYHPPIFSAMKTISYGTWKERIIARCLAHDICIYSPHTTLDSTVGGINDRVLNGFKIGNNQASPVKPIIPSKFLEEGACGVTFSVKDEYVSKILDNVPFQNYPDILLSYHVADSSANLTVFGKSSVEEIVDLVSGLGIPDLRQSPAEGKPIFGAGRIIELTEPIDLDSAVDIMKTHLGLGYVQLAYGGNPKVRNVAVCVGSGSSLLKPIAGKVDLLITGEMSHHDLLECVSLKSSVVLCNHCSSERHYLPDFAKMLKDLTGITNIFVSEEDASPLRLVL